MRIWTALPLALAAILAAAPASALEVRFYPSERVYSYDLATDRDAHAINLQNVAVLNDGAAPVAVETIEVQLLQGERVIESLRVGAPELERAAGNARALAGDTWRMLAFQFGGDRLVPSTMRLSTDTVLDPGEALVFGSQIFAWRGARDQVRVIVNGGAASASLPLRSGVSKTVFRLPLDGKWVAASGPGFNSPHRWSPMEEFAFDLLRIDANGATHRGAGYRFEDYYAYGAPVFAAADGVVVSVIDDQGEDPKAMKQAGESDDAYMSRLRQDQARRIAGGVAGVAGNSVVIDHGDGEYSFYAHLKPGSVRVTAGQRLRRSEQIGLLGSSGNSTEPHLHFQVCNGTDPLNCAGIPIQFEATTAGPGAPQVGDFLSGPDAAR